MFEKLETFLITYINVRKVGDIFNNLYKCTKKLEKFLITYINVRKVGDIFNNL